MEEELKQCVLCPRKCSANRMAHNGYCGESAALRVARASLHMWEEPCISGTRGAGTVFFSGCSLKCVYCQNKDIAFGNKGRELTSIQLSELFLLLQNKGAVNINLVTPTHFVLQIAEAIKMAKRRGLTIPIVYNTSGFENVISLQKLEGLIDIYLSDLKYYSEEISMKYSNAQNYFKIAKNAIDEMVRQIGKPVFEDTLMKRGIIIRHMVLPGYTKDSKAVIKYLYESYGDDIYISIMNQYTPPIDLEGYPEIKRRVTPREYEKVIDYAIELGIQNAFIQEGETSKESFIPDFDNGVYLDEI